MNLGSPPVAYSREDEAQTRARLTKADGENHKKGQDIIFSGDANAAHPALIIKRPDGSLRRLVIDNSDVLSVVAV